MTQIHSIININIGVSSCAMKKKHGLQSWHLGKPKEALVLFHPFFYGKPYATAHCVGRLWQGSQFGAAFKLWRCPAHYCLVGWWCLSNSLWPNARLSTTLIHPCISSCFIETSSRSHAFFECNSVVVYTQVGHGNGFAHLLHAAWWWALTSSSINKT